MDSAQGAQLLLLAGLTLGLAFATWWNCRHVAFAAVPDPEAEARAVQLQKDVLSKEECRELAERGYLDVPSPGVAGRTYRVPAGSGWVEVYESGSLQMRLCVEPERPLPTGDLVIMHKLMIEGNEDHYLRTANVVRPLCWGSLRRHHL